MKFLIIVVEEDGSVNNGICDSFDAAIQALRDWYGDELDVPHRSYTILPLK